MAVIIWTGPEPPIGNYDYWRRGAKSRSHPNRPARLVINGVEHKWCGICERYLTLDNFYPRRNYSATALTARCRKCHNKDHHKYDKSYGKPRGRPRKKPLDKLIGILVLMLVLTSCGAQASEPGQPVGPKLVETSTANWNCVYVEHWASHSLNCERIER